MGQFTSNEESALTEMRGLIFGFSITRSIALAAELGIADLLANGPRSAEELAGKCGVLQHPLYRMLRALAGEGVFTEDRDGYFGLTPMAELLRSDHPRSLRECQGPWALPAALAASLQGLTRDVWLGKLARSLVGSASSHASEAFRVRGAGDTLACRSHADLCL